MVTDRNLTTTRSQVFGDVAKGTDCRVCGRDVEDGRRKTCSDYCDRILTAVMGLLNWSSVRRHVIDRDEETCQRCGFDYSKERRARRHVRALIDEKVGERPESPSLVEVGEAENYDWDDYRNRFEEWRARRDRLKERYGHPEEHATGLEVDHIVPVADGGHPFDPANLQTLCEACHREKTAAENSERGETPSRGELSESLFAFASSDGGEAGVE